MQIYLENKKDAVQFVEDQLPHLKSHSPLIMIIRPRKSEGYSVTIATGGLWDGIVKMEADLNSLKPPTNTSQKPIQDG